MSEKTIQIKGIDRATPQSLSGDGTCQEIINARYLKGCWRPIGTKLQYKNWNLTDYDAIWLHDIENGKVDGEPNYIGYKKDIGELFLIHEFSGVLHHDRIVRDETPSIDINVVFLKRTMIVTSETNPIEVYLWNGKYVQTVSLKAPDVDLSPTSSVTLTTEYVELSTFKDAAASALGNYYALVNSESSINGRLYGSIMYMCAYRLFDGSYILPSIPRYLELSNGGVMTFINGDKRTNYAAKMMLSFNKIMATVNNELYSSEYIGDTKDLIESIGIFATKVQPLHLIDDTTITESLMRNIPHNQNDTVTASKSFKDLLPLNDSFTKLAKSTGWYKIHEFNFEDIVGKSGRTSKVIDTKGFYQDYANRDTLTTDQFTHHSLSAREAYVYNDRLHLANIKTSLGKPYIVWPDSSEDSGKSSENNGVVSIWIKTAIGNAIKVNSVSVPIYMDAVIFSYSTNNYVDAQLKEAERNANPAVIPGSVFIIDKTGQDEIEDYSVEWKEYNGNTPYFLPPEVVGYNDSRAYKMQVTVEINGVSYLLFEESLVKNESMNFAFWHNTTFNTNESSTTSNYKNTKKLVSLVTFPTIAPAEIVLPFDTNRVQVSEIQNPLIFPTKNSYQIGTGSIIKLMAGSEPLSTGQFGQFPLQVFTTKGIWAMEIGLGDVLYTNVLPVNGEVAENPKNIVPVGSGVVYSTVKGLFVVNGRQVTEIGEIVEGKPETGVSGSEEISTLIGLHPTISGEMFTPELSGSISDINFLSYLQNSSVGFDQLNKELVVSNPSKAYSYIFSFESKAWFKISRSFKLLINAYPKLLGVTNTDVISLSNESETQYVNVLIISNCQNFDMPDIHKKIERCIFRSRLTTPAGKQAGLYIFASDDMQKYQLITGHQRSGFGIDMVTQRSHVSARNYVFVINGNLSPDSEIKQIETIFINKWNNNLR